MLRISDEALSKYAASSKSRKHFNLFPENEQNNAQQLKQQETEAIVKELLEEYKRQNPSTS